MLFAVKKYVGLNFNEIKVEVSFKVTDEEKSKVDTVEEWKDNDEIKCVKLLVGKVDEVSVDDFNDGTSVDEEVLDKKVNNLLVIMSVVNDVEVAINEVGLLDVDDVLIVDEEVDGDKVDAFFQKL